MISTIKDVIKKAYKYFFAKRFRIFLLLVAFIFGLYYCFHKNTDIKYFERISGIKFPNSYQIQDNLDNCETFVRLKLKLDISDAIKMIDQYKFKKFMAKQDFSSKLADEKYFVHYVSFFFLNSDFKKIPTHNNVFYIDSCTKTNRILYLLDKCTGDFWGIIEYPDWGGDSPCGK